MVEKKSFDTFLIDLMKRTPSIRYSMVLDREGFPISYVGQNLEDRQNVKTLGAVFRSLFSAIYEYAGVYNISTPILSAVFLTDRIILQVNLGYGLANFIVNKYNWPVIGSDLQAVFNDLLKNLPHLQTNKKSLLKDLFPDGMQQNVSRFQVTDDMIPTIIDCLNQFGKGTFGKLDWPINGSDPASVCAAVGDAVGQSALNTIIISQEGTALYSNGADPEKMGKIITSSFDSELLDLNESALGIPLLTIYCFEKGETILIAPIGVINESPVQLSYQLPNWNIGINQAISIAYSAAASCHDSMGSEASIKFIELMNFLMSDVSELKNQIDGYIQSNDNDHARELMERSAYLLRNMDQISMAADYLKWIAYTYFQSNQYPDALENYDRALKLYQLAQNFENEANNHLDIASVYEIMKKRSFALDEYQKAYTLYKDLGMDTQLEDLQKKISEIKAEYKTQLQDYISTMNGESLMFDFISEKFNIKPTVVPVLLEELVAESAIPGQVDTFKGRYTKSIMRTKGSMKAMSNTAGEGINSEESNGVSLQVKTIDYSTAYEDANKLKTENIQLNSELTQVEHNFQVKGINFMDLIKYQAKLEKKNFNELRVRIFTELPSFNDPNGIPTTCAVCLNAIDASETISVCPHGHGFHSKCLSKWIKTQDRCPVCNEKLLPGILRDYRDGSGMPVQGSSNKGEIENLQQQIATLKQSLGSDSSMFDTLNSEREDKQRLMNDLKKKDRLINELKSQLEAVKKR